jgi:transforming growth factor-beta-induced protein
MKKYLVLALCLVLCVSLLYCGKKKEEAPKTEEMAAPGDIVEIASGDGHFTTLVTALNAAGLVETLKGEGPFTVFAPTDSAFAKLPPGTVESLLQDVPTLKNILLYHVVPGKFMAADVAGMKKAATALGDSVSIMVMPDGTVMVGDADIVVTDIQAKNGVIHVIDKVMLPPRK